MEYNENPNELIKKGICPKEHETEEKVCKKCFEDLLKKLRGVDRHPSS